MTILTPHTYHTYPLNELGMDGPYVSRATYLISGLSMAMDSARLANRGGQARQPMQSRLRYCEPLRTRQKRAPSQTIRPLASQSQRDSFRRVEGGVPGQGSLLFDRHPDCRWFV